MYTGDSEHRLTKDQRLIEKLLKEDEGPYLDFKSETYRLDTDYFKAVFIKDILSMANTPREVSAYIVTGVRVNADRSKTVIEVTKHPDDADLQSLIESKVDPVPQFQYRSIVYQDKSLGIIEIYPKRGGVAFTSTWGYKGILREYCTYFRRGSKNAVARPDDLKEINAWMLRTKPLEQVIIEVTQMTVPPQEELSEKFLKDPFQNTPLLSYYCQKIKRSPLKGKHILILLHFLRDLVPFVKAMRELGLDPKASYFYYKEYPYPQREAIASWLKKQGCNVGLMAELDNDLKILEEGYETQIGELLIIEDGGHIYPHIMQSHPRLLKHVQGCIEQTRRGIRNIENTLKHLETIPEVPVLSVADSELKSNFEPPIVADAVVRNIRSLLDNVNFRGRHVAVLGYGTIGEKLAERLRNEGMLVTVYDPDSSRLLKASQAGLNIAESAVQAVRYKFLVIGSSGECTIKRDEILALSHGTYLASASSEQYEIATDELIALSGSRTTPFAPADKVAGTAYTLRKDENQVVLLANGYPINFWGMNSMPDQASDLILTLLLLSLDNVAIGKVGRGGINTKCVNDLAEEYGVANLYLEHHGVYQATAPSMPSGLVLPKPTDMQPQVEKIAKIIQRYHEKVEAELRTRRYRSWRQHYIIPFSLERLEWEADYFTVKSAGFVNTLSDAMQGQPRQLLLGGPGTGKTAMLEQYVVDHKDDACPILITSGYSSNDPISLIRQAFSEHRIEASQEAVQAGLMSQRFCLLIDGFDERDDDERKQIRQLCTDPNYSYLPIIVTSRETFYVNLPEAQRLPHTFNLLRIQPISPAYIKAYLINRLGDEQGIADWNAIHKQRLEKVFQTPLILEKFTERRQVGQPVPHSKSELLTNYFNDFFSAWEPLRGYRAPDVKIKYEVLTQLAYFLFSQRRYTVATSDFESELSALWDNLLRQHPSLHSIPHPLKFLEEHGLLARLGNETGFAQPLYRDFFLIKGRIPAALSWQQQWQLAEICRDLDFEAEAEELYKRASFDPESSGPCRIATALYYKARGNYLVATKLFRLEQERLNPAGYQAHAIMLKEQGRFEEAEKQFKLGLKADPTNAHLYQAYAIMLKEQGRLEEAEKQFKLGLKVDPTSAPLYQAYAIMLKEQGCFEEAGKQFKLGLKVDPTHAPLYQAYALMLKEQGRFEEARQLWEKIIQIHPDDLEYRLDYLCLLFYCLDALTEAGEVAKKLQDQKGLTKLKKSDRYYLKLTVRLMSWRHSMLTGNAKAHQNTQQHYQYAGRLIDHFNFKRGVEELYKLLGGEPTHANAHWRLAYTLTAHDKVEEGLEHAKLAVSLEPEQPKYRFQLAHSAIHAGDFSLAHDQLDWLLERFPTNTDYLRTRGFAFRQAKRWCEAEAAYQVAVSVAMTSEDRARTLKNLAQSMMEQEGLQRWETAWQLLERAWALHLSDPTIFGTRKELAEKLGKPARIDSPYQLIRDRLEAGDPISVRVYQSDEASGVQVYYYGVPGRLPWIEEGDKLQIGEQIKNILVQGVNGEGKLQLSWPRAIEQKRQMQAETRKQRLEKIQQMNLEPGQDIDAVVSDSRNYGVLVDYQGIQGLIRRSTMPDPKAFDPETFPFVKGETIRCRVLRIQADGRLELSWEAQ